MTNPAPAPATLPAGASVAPGPGGLPVLTLRAVAGAVQVCLLGAHVLSWIPASGVAAGQDVLWRSGSSWYEDGKPIRGGIPVCGPWFGPHGLVADAPAHGLWRTRLWTLVRVESLANGGLRAVLALDVAAVPAFPTAHHVEMAVTLGETLDLELSVRNQGQGTMLVSSALHTYFTVADVRNIEVRGLAGTTRIDRMAGTVAVQDNQPVTFASETDQVHQGRNVVSVLRDPGLGRAVTLSPRGSGSTVVWNPWIAKAARMPDFGDAEWTGMVCVETANALDAAVAIPPSTTTHMGVTIAVGPA